jgi:hypothetical protein
LGFLDPFPNDDGLWHLFPDDNRLLGRDNRGFVADDDGLRGLWWGRLRAEELGGAGVPFKLVRLVVSLLLLKVAFVFA